MARATTSASEAGRPEKVRHREVAAVQTTDINCFHVLLALTVTDTVFQQNLCIWSILENSLLFIQGSTILNFITCSNLICITPKITQGKVALKEGYNMDGNGDTITLLKKAQAGGSPAGL